MSVLFVSQLSPHLFWDVDPLNVEAEKNKSFIIQRVLEYGFIEDWRLINKWYGLQTITRIAQNLRNLEPRAMTFISMLTGVPKDQFRCYSIKQSIPPHWSF